MSSPIDRPSKPDDVIRYAPKWARDREALHEAQPPMARRDSDPSKAYTHNPDFRPEPSARPDSLEPSLVPEPPIPESWRRNDVRFRAGGRHFIRAPIRFFLVTVVAAVTGIVIGLVFPRIENFMMGERPAATSAGTRVNGEGVESPARSPTTSNEPRQTGLSRSKGAASTADQRNVAVNAVTVPFASPSPARPTQSAIATPEPANTKSPPAVTTVAPENAKSMASALANTAPAAPAAAAPPPAIVTPNAAPVPVKKFNTVPAKPETPVRVLGHDEIETLLKQGNDFVSIGDFASARIVFGRVAEAGDSRGAMAYAEIYDPIVLARIGAKGATPDVAKAREWYAKARELGSPDATSRLEALASRGATSVAPTSQSAAMVPTGLETPSQVQPREASASAGSYWKHDGSIMRLQATGIGRKFLFYKPSDAALETGAKPGSLRFEGQISGKVYTGIAFLYSRKCGRLAFPVSGEIQNNEGQVTLSGKAPQVDGDCRAIGKIDDTLVFVFMGAPH